jgi:hypothetical protein
MRETPASYLKWEILNSNNQPMVCVFLNIVVARLTRLELGEKEMMRTTIIIAAALACTGNAMAQERGTFDLTAECTTEPTGYDGVRHDCASEPTCFTAPANFAINQQEVSVIETSGAGNKHDCSIIGWGDYVEIVDGTGLKMPRTLCGQASAGSPDGALSGRGWAACHFSGYYVRYAQ